MNTNHGNSQCAYQPKSIPANLAVGESQKYLLTTKKRISSWPHKLLWAKVQLSQFLKYKNKWGDWMDPHYSCHPPNARDGYISDSRFSGRFCHTIVISCYILHSISELGIYEVFCKLMNLNILFCIDSKS